MHTPRRECEMTFKYLASAKKVLGGLGFKYVGGNIRADAVSPGVIETPIFGSSVLPKRMSRGSPRPCFNRSR
jgi:hypothetical protein